MGPFFFHCASWSQQFISLACARSNLSVNKISTMCERTTGELVSVVCHGLESAGLWGCAAVTCSTGNVNLCGVMVCMLLWRVQSASHMHEPVTEVGCPWGCSSCPYSEPAVWQENAWKLWRHHRNTASEQHGEHSCVIKGNTPGGIEPWTSHTVPWEEKRKKRREGRRGDCRLPWPLRLGFV